MDKYKNLVHIVYSSMWLFSSVFLLWSCKLHNFVVLVFHSAEKEPCQENVSPLDEQMVNVQQLNLSVY